MVVQDGEKFILSRNEEKRLKNMIVRAVVKRKVMVTTLKMMMINRRISKLDVDPAGEWDDRFVL